MNVIGIDPAPKKGLHYFGLKLDQEPFGAIKAVDSAEFVTSLPDDVLICWDAPLTGPFLGDNNKVFPGSFTKRIIERFFSTKDGMPTPRGISVQSYSTCAHWTISQYCLGLPSIDPRSKSRGEQPFRLVTKNTPPTEGRHVVEVHPGLALWLWCRKDARDATSWLYKKSQTIRESLWEIFSDKSEVKEILSGFSGGGTKPKNDDQFDAMISYVLGRLWLKPSETGNPSVILLGDERTGALLLPNCPGIEDKFCEFKKSKFPGLPQQ